MMASDPSWFYSSLSQVTAAIVAFFGGFLILRLIDQAQAWRKLRERLDRQQAEWLDLIFPIDVNDLEAEGVDEPPPEQERASRERLVGTLREKENASIPVELRLGGVCLIALVGLGVIWPLMALEAPSVGTRALVLVPWSLIVAAFGTVIYLAAYQVLRGLRKAVVYPRVQAMFDEAEQAIEDRKRRIGEREKKGGT